MSSNQCYEWFVEPMNAKTNESIARELPEENLRREVSCNDGVTRTLWECSFSLVKFLWKSRSCGIDIKVYNRLINSGTGRGKAKDVTFLLRHSIF